MKDLIDVFTDKSEYLNKKDEDFADRLNSTYTTLILVAFALIVSIGIHVGDPIECFVPQHFTGSHTGYTNAYCWVRNTYYLPYEDEIPKEHEHGEEGINSQELPYYQWIPFILAGQAIFFYLPNAIWHALNVAGGVDVDVILDQAATMHSTEKLEEKENVLLIITNQIHRFLSTRKTIAEGRAALQNIRQSGGTLISGRRMGCYIVCLYIFCKCLYVINVIGQLYWLNHILALDFSVYGIDVFKWMYDSHDWTTSPDVAFPRVTMCDFKVRRLGNIHRYTVQCTLPINLYNEKIYMFLWFWMVFVAAFTVLSLVIWLCRLLKPSDRLIYIRNHLKMMRTIRNEDNFRTRCDKFTKDYLHQDGVFLLRLIGHNTNTLAVSEIIQALYENWKKLNHYDTTNNEEEDYEEEIMPAKEYDIDD